MKLISWLLSRFAVAPELIGDITEDYAERGSFIRLARQSAVAIATTVPRGLWQHRRLTLCAVETGWFLCFLWSQVPNASAPWWIEQPYQLTFGINLVVAFLLGWIVTRLQDRQPLGAVLLFVFPLVLMQVNTDAHNIRSILEEGKPGEFLRFLEIQLWFAWLPLVVIFAPPFLAKPQRFSKP